jgi:UDP-3-O-acyl-N-acetylglucosamine deacetylase
VIIELNASELPIMDGSSKYFVEALKKQNRRAKCQSVMCMLLK